MMPRRWCESCLKSYAHRQSLFKHRKRCNGGGNKGQGFSIPAIVPYERKKQTGKDLFGLVKHNQSDESSSSESSSSSDEFISDDDEEDYLLWETLVKFCERSGENIVECLMKVFLLYKSCENDDVFQQLLKDVELAKENGYSLKDAFHYAVELRKKFDCNISKEL